MLNRDPLYKFRRKVGIPILQREDANANEAEQHSSCRAQKNILCQQKRLLPIPE
jgi:hypothetical protein